LSSQNPTGCYRTLPLIGTVSSRRDQRKVEIPIAHRVRPAGSGTVDFPTPRGVRNSKRKATVRCQTFVRGKLTFNSHPKGGGLDAPIGRFPVSAKRGSLRKQSLRQLSGFALACSRLSMFGDVTVRSRHIQNHEFNSPNLAVLMNSAEYVGLPSQPTCGRK